LLFHEEAAFDSLITSLSLDALVQELLPSKAVPSLLYGFWHDALDSLSTSFHWLQRACAGAGLQAKHRARSIQGWNADACYLVIVCFCLNVQELASKQSGAKPTAHKDGMLHPPHSALALYHKCACARAGLQAKRCQAHSTQGWDAASNSLGISFISNVLVQELASKQSSAKPAAAKDGHKTHHKGQQQGKASGGCAGCSIM
jgi:hypothetical protein